MDDLEKAFNKFKGKNCSLVKTGSKRENFSFSQGDSIKGRFFIQCVKSACITRVAIDDNYKGIITSPVIKILEETDNSIKFETEGGFYTLEVLPEQKQSIETLGAQL